MTTRTTVDTAARTYQERITALKMAAGWDTGLDFSRADYATGFGHARMLAAAIAAEADAELVRSDARQWKTRAAELEADAAALRNELARYQGMTMHADHPAVLKAEVDRLTAEVARDKALLNALCSLGATFGNDDEFRRCAAAGLAAWAMGKDGAEAVDEAVHAAPELLAPPRSVSRVGEWVYIDRSVPLPSDVRTGTLRDIWPDGTATVDLDRKSGTVTVPHDKLELYIPF